MAKSETHSNETIQQVEQLFNLGAHLGHRKSRVHPKSYKYIHRVVNGVSIIDLTQTVTLMEKAKKVLTDYAKEGKKVLLVATKKNVAAVAAEIAEKHNMPFTTAKWLPGLLTNFDTIIKNVHKLEKMKEQQKNGEWEQFVKHERTEMSKQLYRLERFYKGLVGLKKKPDMLLIVDSRKEKNAVVEARKHDMPIVAIVDTNSNPDEVNFPIVMNDDAPEVVQHVLTELVTTYSSAYTETKEAQPEAPAEGEAKTEEAKPAAQKAAPVKKEAPAAEKETAPAKTAEAAPAKAEAAAPAEDKKDESKVEKKPAKKASK